MAKRRKSKKKKVNNNNLLTLIIIIIILGIISVVAAYFMLDEEQKNIPQLIENITSSTDNDIETPIETKPVEEKIITSPIDGTWVSNYDGAMLTISNGSFSIEMPSVDASSKIKGSLAVENTIVTFINVSGNKSCIGIEGHYNYSFKDGELMLNMIKDKCEIRSERMRETWFKL